MVRYSFLRKVVSEVVLGSVVLLLVAYQALYQLPRSQHYDLKLAGITVQAALGILILSSAALMIKRRKQFSSPASTGSPA